MIDNDIISIGENLDELGWEAMQDSVQEEIQTVSLPQLKLAAMNYLNVVNSLNQQITIF